MSRSRTSIRDSGPGLTDAGPCEIHAGDVSGRYLLAISVTLAPGKPIVSLADVSTPAFGGGVGVAFGVQPLSAADRTTPVGTKIDLGPFAVDAAGAYRADVPGLQVTGAANPVTGGDITADVVLSGSLCGDGHFFCGAVSGAVQKPLLLDLKGSTFTLTRIDADGGLPTLPPIDCNGTLSDPL